MALKSSDALGLGFHITGSLADGIFVGQVEHRGPAFESGLVAAGDIIILGLHLNFRTFTFYFVFLQSGNR